MSSEIQRQIPGRVKTVLLILWMLGFLPFLFQPFHIDDRIYLEIADNVLNRPLYPYDYVPSFEGMVAPDAASHSHLPLTSYYLAAVKWTTGSHREWIFHLAFSVFLWLLAVGSYDLSRRYVRYPLAVAALVVFAPGVLVLGHTLMTEVPLVSLWVFSLSRFLRLVEDGWRWTDWIQAAASLLAASFVSLLAGGLVLLMAAYLVVGRFGPGRRVRPGGLCRGASAAWILGLLVLPWVLWVLWYLRAYLHYDRFVLVQTLMHLNQREAFSWLPLGAKLLTLLLSLGGAFLFPVAAWYGFSRRWTGRVSALVGIGGGLYVAWLADDWELDESVLFGVLLGTGLVILLGVTRTLLSRTRSAFASGRESETTGRGKDVLLLLWFLGILCSFVILYPSGSVRYALLATPPIAIAWVLAVQKVTENLYFQRNLVVLGILLSTLTSVPLAITDYRYASMYRDLAHQLVQDYQREGRTVWFTAEWGLRYYLEQSGARLILRTGNEAVPGDIIVKPYIASPWVTLYDSSEYLRLLEQREAQLASPLRILDFSSHAGFYSSAWGPLPYSFGREGRWEWINVFEVVKRYEGPIPDPGRHY